MAVNTEKVKQAAVIASSDCGFSDGMAATADTLRNPGDSEINCWQPKVDEVNGIAAVLEIFEPGRKGSARECRFEREIAPIACEFAYSP